MSGESYRKSMGQGKKAPYIEAQKDAYKSYGGAQSQAVAMAADIGYGVEAPEDKYLATIGKLIERDYAEYEDILGEWERYMEYFMHGIDFGNISELHASALGRARNPLRREGLDIDDELMYFVDVLYGLGKVLTVPPVRGEWWNCSHLYAIIFPTHRERQRSEFMELLLWNGLMYLVWFS